MTKAAPRRRFLYESPAGELSLELDMRQTELAFADAAEHPINEVFRLFVEDEQRTTLVCDDVLAALAEGRRCLVLRETPRASTCRS